MTEMRDLNSPAIAIVGVGAVLPDAPTATEFWANIRHGRYSIQEVPSDRWDPELFYDPDPRAPAKTYSKIGGWVQDWDWDPMAWRLPIPPKVADAMDLAQKWAVAGARQALADYGYPQRPLNSERTAVIFGNAMAGDQHYLTAIRIFLPEYELELARTASFADLEPDLQAAIRREFGIRIAAHFPEITEDSMPGELGNIIAGRVANLFDFHGPNFVTDAACASAMAAVGAAIEGLEEHDFDAVITGGIDSNMSASTFTKFCKIGALSATGTRPYAEGADGFVMGEGAAVFILKRLADAVRDEDSIYALIRGVGGSSDGRGKGITAPNPTGQRLAVERAWQRAGVVPDGSTLMEGHGTSTRVGDVVEVESLTEALRPFGLPAGSIPLGSVKSNIGHLKGAAGAAGLLKAALALRDKVLPPSLGCSTPNPNIDFESCPFYVNSELRDWQITGGDVRRAGVSAFGFGGTNFHVVLEEYRPGMEIGERKSRVSVELAAPAKTLASSDKEPLRGALMIGAASEEQLVQRLQGALQQAETGQIAAPRPPAAEDLAAPFRLAIDYEHAEELVKKATKALTILENGRPEAWKPLQARGVFFGQGPALKVAMLFTGQGSQYLNMLRELAETEPIVSQTFARADAVMTPLLGRPLTEFLFIDDTDEETRARAEEALRQTSVTQPAVLTVDIALTRLMAAYGMTPDFVMGHSLGEYGALVAAGAMDFRHALEAVSARGTAMMNLTTADNGGMAAVFAPLADIERVLATVEGYVVVANINSPSEAVIGGAGAAVAAAVEALNQAGFDAKPLPVSHAFHTDIVAPVSDPLRSVLETMALQPPELPIISNVTGDFYPMGPGVESEMIDLLARQVAQPVQFVRGLETLYRAGARIFIEMGPKRALQGMVRGVFQNREGVRALSTNHPRLGDLKSFNQALCGLWAAGLGVGLEAEVAQSRAEAGPVEIRSLPSQPRPAAPVQMSSETPVRGDTYLQLGKMFADVLERGMELYSGGAPAAPDQPVVVTGASLGLPGTDRVFDDRNAERLLTGQQFIHPIPGDLRQAMVDKNITRLVKSEQGGPHFETIDDTASVIKLAARAGQLDLVEEFGYPKDRDAALDVVTRLAIGAGLDALRDAGIPLVRRYKTTTKGTQLPDSWGLPEELRDDTGIIFASAFPGVDFFAAESKRYYQDRARRDLLSELTGLREKLRNHGNGGVPKALARRIEALERELQADPYTFERRFLFKLLSMGHSQFAELIGARGPNTQINGACASGTQAISLAEDWIRGGRCRRVVIISADNVTSDEVLEWIGAGFLASGAAATDERVEDAAIPFDRRRHGMIIGMGAASLVVESPEAARERGLEPICQVLSTVTANSAFHGTRLDVEHISQVMETLIRQAESRWSLDRQAIAPETVFISHETYTPARGGSAQAEIFALRRVFGAAADQIVIANTKGYTGHPMAVAMEEVLAVKSLETGLVPPVANIQEIDPELGDLNLSRGGEYPVRYALRLGAGFGSQISMSLLRLHASSRGRRPGLRELGYAFRIADEATWQRWLSQASGYPAARVEVSHRTLRVSDEGPPSKRSAAPAVVEPVAEPQSVPDPPVPAPLAEVPREAELSTPSPREAGDPVADRILDMVAEMTGYPQDMLDLDLDMEADLGIDTVKQAEMFAAIRAEWSIPRDDNLQLRDFPTLAHSIQFVYDRRPDLLAERPTQELMTTGPRGQAVEAPAQQAGESAPIDDPVGRRILQLVSELTGYPEDMLDLDLDMEADLGIDTVKQAEMFAAIRAAWDIPRDDDLQLRDFPTLAHAIGFVYDRRPDLSTPGPAQVLDSPTDSASAEKVSGTEDQGDPVAEQVLSLVAGLTGYPQDMLDLDLDMEADLGIDTVKQAEMFAAIREEWNIPRDENLQLRDFPTLAHAIQFVYDRRPDLASTEGSESDTAKPAPAEDMVREQAATLSAAMPAAIPRRVPVALVRPPLELCKSTPVGELKGRRIVVMPDEDGVGVALSRVLHRRGAEVLLVEGAPDRQGLRAQLEAWTATGAVDGVYWLPALDSVGELTDLGSEEWQRALAQRVKLLHTAMRTLYESFDEERVFLVAGTRMGGRHGYDESGAWCPLGGGVSGFAKAFKRERPRATVKVVDLAADESSTRAAELLIEETLRDPGIVEVGYADDRRWTVGLMERELVLEEEEATLPERPVFVVTGAAGSIVSAIVADLAQRWPGDFYLLDLTPEPVVDDPDLELFRKDPDTLKRVLFDRLKESGEKATPAVVEKLVGALERSGAALSAMSAITSAGGEAHYRQVDLLDGRSVSKVVEEVRQRHGRIDVLIHAAGMEISHMLSDKTESEFDLIFDVKAQGWFHLLRSAGDMEIGATVVFASIAGRFGNAGQTDYSAANDLLCKLSSNLRTTRPGTRGIAIDWSAWAEIGMASRGSIPKMMEQAGIDMVPPEIGIPVVGREIANSGGEEIVVAGSLGGLLEEWDESGGLDTEAMTNRLQGPMVARALQFGLYSGLVAEVTLDPTGQPFLKDHRIDGIAVLPGVMGIEAFAEVGAALLPGWTMVGVEEMHFLAPFKFYRDEPRKLEVQGIFRADGDEVLGYCRLVGRRSLAKGERVEETLHFTGRIRWARQAAAPESVAEMPSAGSDLVEPDTIYKLYFHGPAYQVLGRAWRQGRRVMGQLSESLPIHHEPESDETLSGPRLAELCFQTAGLVEFTSADAVGLPRRVTSIRIFGPVTEDPGIVAVVERSNGGDFEARVVDGAGNVRLEIKGYETIEAPMRMDAEPLAILRRTLGESETEPVS